MAKPCTPHLIAQRVQFFKPGADNGGVKGQGPLRSLGGSKGGHSLHVRECPPLLASPRQAGKTAAVSGRKKEGTTFRWSPIFYSLRKRAAMRAAASSVDIVPVSR